ncbi:MAG TPA: hypothetical protein DC047_01935 [Blastocatellia bacterium]|nr:hypothetical protein [Blastocatellia bacterium]
MLKSLSRKSMRTASNPETNAIPDSVVEHGAVVYSTQLQAALESQHSGEFVAVDPSSARYFLGQTATAALVAARNAMPDTQFFLTRIGSDSAHKIGGHGKRIR